MPKPEKVETHVLDWLRQERQDELTAFTRVITKSMINPGTTVTSSTMVADLRIPVEALGRDISDMWGVPGHARALVVTPSTFHVLRLSGFKERVKDSEAEAPLDGVMVHHMDQMSESGLGIRYFVMDLPDGRWLADSHAYAKKNGEPTPYARHSDEFIAALGQRAAAIG